MTTPDARPTITAADEGCWFAGASSRTADELNACVVLAAMRYGWTPDDASELRTLAESTDGWADDPDDGQWLSDAGWQAMEYLDSVAPDGYAFTFDDGFYMLAVCAMDGWEGSDADPCPHGDDCPNATESPDTCLNTVDGHWYVITYGRAPYQIHALDCDTCARERAESD